MHAEPTRCPCPVPMIETELAVSEQELWGPGQLITPIVDDALDDEIDEEGVGGLILGNDFLHSVWVTFMGEHKLVVISYQPSEA